MKFPIFLVGFMASGKTSKGNKLARKLGVDFIDLDAQIEEKEKRSISRIFKENGEVYFRKIEAEAVRAIPERTKAVIALGGGTPCFHGNMEVINTKGTSVYLKRSAARILGRLRRNKDKRPIVAHLEDAELKIFITESLEKRQPHYEMSAIHFDADSEKLDDLLNRLLQE